MAIIELDVSVSCSSCGAELRGESYKGCADINVDVCPGCIHRLEEKIRLEYRGTIEWLESQLAEVGEYIK